MKLTPSAIDKAVLWVRMNGLYPQNCGAPIKAFCEFMEIDFKTYQRWMLNSNFANAIKKAQQDFRADTVVEVVNALKKRALGYQATESSSEYKAQVVKEYDPKTGKKVKEYTTDKGVKIKESRTEKNIAPDPASAIFLLTNLDPENWKNRRDNKTDIELDVSNETPPVIMFTKSKPDKEGEDQD